VDTGIFGCQCLILSKWVTMTTNVELDISKFLPWQKKVLAKYRFFIMQSVAETLDNTRQRAVKKYIIPRRNTSERRLSKLYKIQPTNPTKLTERTGALNKMLLEDTSPPGRRWTRGEKVLKMSTSAMRAVVRTTGGFNQITETWRGDLFSDIKSVALYSQFRHRMDIEGQKFKVLRETAQTLAMRFRHDTGIRGFKRPFLTPAAQDEMGNMRHLISMRAAKLRSM
jgi:hypothetical protein